MTRPVSSLWVALVFALGATSARAQAPAPATPDASAASPAAPNASAASPAASPDTVAQPSMPAGPTARDGSASPGTQAPPYPAYELDASDYSRPRYLEYQPGNPRPHGYALESYVPKGYIIAGSITFGVGYGLGFLAALSNQRDKDFNANWLFLPVAGPFIGLATQHETCNDYYGPDRAPSQCGRNSRTTMSLVALGTMQIVGAGLFTYGLTHRRQRLVRQDSQHISITPVQWGRTGGGLAVAGTF